MRFSRYQSVANGKKDNSVRNKFKGRKKHKRLDAICEKAYNRSHIRALQAGPSEVNNGGSEMELRRSNRSRRAPMLLDSSPMPPKKRRKVEKSIYSSTQKVSATQLQRGVPPSCLRDLDEQNAAWGLRLRSRVKSESSSRREKGQPVHRGKRKLFDELDGLQNGMFTENNNKVELVGERSTVVKSKRPGRIKASKVADIDEQKIDLGSGMEDGEEERNKVLDETYDAAALPLEIKVDNQSEVGLEGSFGASKLAKKEDDAVQRDSDLEKCRSNGVVEKEGDCIESESLNFDLINYQVGNNTQVDSGTVGQAKDVASPHKPLEDETCETLEGKYNTSATAGGKPLGRRCGLCGGGTDGKPPKILLLDVGGSDNESCSMSSGSVERPNYDLLDGFGDHSGWLGRLLGPINDRFGIAGIWVHQQCAVWSPEVYFAGLGCLKNVRAALYRGRMLKCTRCRRRGATIGCRVDRCPRTYHLACARARDCIFDHRKFLIACTDHRHLFQPHGVQNARRLKKIKAKKLKMELRKISSDACRKDVEAEERWLENCGEDEEFVKRERKRLHRDLLRMAPTYIGGGSSPAAEEFQGWESVAGLKDVIQCMKEVVVLPLLYPEFFNNLGLAPPRGVLLHGYPGTGKTLVLRALVGSLSRGDRKIAYFARKGADCLGKYVGDAERQLRLLFQVAEKHQPSIILFDEIDGLAPCRTKQQDQTHISVVSTLLALMDGLKSRGSVIVIGTTNRPDSVDTALRRPGRFDREIFFPLPSAEDREAILSLHTQKWPKPVSGSILKWVAKRTVGFAGADLQALCTQAVMVALRRSFPLQEILSAAETGDTISKCRVPSFFVEEKDWLQALSCAPPPCSRRESGISLNDVACSLLKIHFVPYLLQPLARLLVSLHMDDRIWLPLNLSKASTVLKNTIISVLHSREVQSDSWWLHVDGLLQEVDVANEIEKNLLLATVMVEESNICGSDVIQVEDEEVGSKNSSSNSQFMGTRPGLLQMMPHEPCNKSGFHLLFCGNPRSGQRHLASCLLQFFVGNIDLWKIDLSSISHEGHGDLVNGLRNILARCAGAKLCLLYMPAIELWAIETKGVSEYSCEPSPVKQPQPARKIYYGVQSELDKAPELCSSPDAVGTLSQTATRKASYLWNSFLEQVESIRVNSSMIILATSEIPFPSLPNRIKDFFGDEILSCSLPVSFAHKLPRFSVDLDGKFDLYKVINSFAAKLSKDLAVHFVQSHRGGNHIPFEGIAYDMVQEDVDGVIPAKSPNSSSLSPIGCTNKPSKGKSGLQLALSTFGYQILVYPHFAELCWVTSKLKEGPAAKTDGPWKGWPFNSCIVRPVNPVVSVPGAVSSSNIKSKDYGLVRGLVAVGLSAYRGEYASLKKVCSEVRKVLEALVERISKKVHAGKDQIQFVRVLSQVAYLEDMVNSWAYALRSLDVGTADAPDISSLGKDLLENTPQLVDARDESHPEPTTVDDGCTDAFDEAAVGTVGTGSPRSLALSNFSPRHTLGSNKVHLQSPMAEAAPDTVEMLHALPAKHANGFIDRSSIFEPDGPSHCSGDEDRTEHSSPAEPNVFSSTDASTVFSGASQKPSGSTCFYHCCPECFTNLHNLLLRIINTECGLKKGSILAIEDLDDILSSLSANLHLSLNRLSPGDNVDTTEEACSRNGKCCTQQQSSDLRRNSYQMLPKECGCHEMTVNARGKENIAQLPQWLDLRFVFKDGVLAAIETGSSDVSYHCKFEKLCLCSLIEWLVKEKKKCLMI